MIKYVWYGRQIIIILIYAYMGNNCYNVSKYIGRPHTVFSLLFGELLNNATPTTDIT
jgi:hypothetical protein